MTPVIPSPTSKICLIPRAAFPRSKSICLTRCYDLRKYTKQTSYAQDLVFPLSTSVGLFPRIRTYSLNCKSRIQIVSATGTDIVEEPESPLADKDNGEALGISSLGEMHVDISSKAESTRTQARSKHSRYVRKSEMPPVKNDEVVPGEALGISSIVETHEGMSIKADSTRTQAQSKRSRPVSKSEMPPVKNGELVPGEALGISSVVEETHENISSKADSTRTHGQSKRSRPVSKSEMPKVKNEELIPGEALGISSVVEETHENISSTADSTRTQARPKRSRPVRKSEMPPVKNEALVPGATFTGKVRSIPPFGAFVDFGAFTDGLVHVSNLSDSFVKDVRMVVSVGQEVKVRLVEANFETGRISLSMRESDEMTKQSSDDSNKTRPSRKNSQKSNQRRDEGKRMSKFVKGQNLEGKVKSLTRTGALISLPDGDEGYLPAEEEADDGLASIMGSSTLKVDQEVSVRVLQINRGKVTLTMRKEEDVGGLESKLTGTVYTATNAFVFAFRKNKEIASFLDQIEKEKESKGMTGVLSAIDETIEDEEISQDEVDMGSCATIDRETSAPSPVQNEDMSSCPLLSPESEVIEVVENQIDNTSANDELLLQTPTGREIPSAQPVEDNNVGVGPTPMQNGIINNSSGESSAAKAISPNLVSRLRSETGAGIMDCFNALSETGGDIVKAQIYLKKKGLASADKKSSRATMEGRIGSYIHDAKIGVLVEANCETDIVSRGNIFKELVDNLAMQVAACPQVQYINREDVPKGTVEKEREIEMQREDILSKPEQIRAKIIEGRIQKRLEDLALLEQPYIKNDKIKVKDIIKQTIPLIGEGMKVKRFVRFDLGEGLEKKSKDFMAKVAAQNTAKQAPTPPKEQPTKSSWPAAEGRIGSYIHDSHIGVLIEVICETEFVGRSNEFKELADTLAMQVAVSSQVQFVSIDDIPAGILGKEKEEEMHREDILSQPENIRDKVVKLALLEQPFVRDDKILVKDLVKLYADVLGEKVKVRRFVRFTVGEESDAKRETRA